MEDPVLFDPDQPTPTPVPDPKADPSLERRRNPDGTFAPTAPAVPESPKHPSWLIEQARELEYSEEDIASMPTDALGRSVRVQQKVQQKSLEKLSREFATQRTLQEAQVTPPEPEEDLGLNESEGYDPKLLGVLKRLARENKSLKSELGGVKQSQQSLTNMSITERIDQAFEQIGAECVEYAKWLGSGTHRELDGPELQVRNFILGKAKVNVAQLPPFKQLIARLRATVEEFVPKVKAQDAGPYTPTTEPANGPTAREWEEGGVARPTQRNGAAEPDGEQKAIRNLERKYRESGQLGGAGRSETLNGFLP